MAGETKGISRIELLLHALGLSQKELSERTGISRPVISHYQRGEREITNKSALKIVREFPNVNLDWLLNGEGEMFKDSDSDADPLDGLDEADLVSELRERLRIMEQQMNQKDEQLRDALAALKIALSKIE